jgi:hypothetical protein
MLFRALLIFVSFCSVPAAFGQDLDKQAWNEVWDRLEDVVRSARNSPLAPTEIVHVLKVPRPLAYGDHSWSGAIQLQNIAGIIPKRDFALDPSENDKRLAIIYSGIVKNVTLPTITPTQQHAIDVATGHYQTAWTAFEIARKKWNSDRNEEYDNLAHRKILPDDDFEQRTRDALSGDVQVQVQNLQNAIAEWQNALPPDFELVNSIQALRNAQGGTSDIASNGIWRYVINDPITDRSKKCDPDKPDGWMDIGLSKSLQTQSTRSSDWNGNGSFGGSFFSIGAGGGGSNYSNVVTGDSSVVRLRFCNIQYVSVSAPWYDQTLLEDIDEGTVKLKPDSSQIGHKMLGSQGLIPRLVKGLIVARDIRFEATIGATKMEELKQSWSGQGGFGIGPFHFGGGGGGSSYHRTDANSSGTFSFASAYEMPIVLAIVTEETIPPNKPATAAVQPGHQ